MARSLSANQARAKLRSQDDCYMLLTFEAGSPAYSLNNGAGVTRKAAAELTGQGLLPGIPEEEILKPQGDGLFPGFSQTWKMGG